MPEDHSFNQPHTQSKREPRKYALIIILSCVHQKVFSDQLKNLAKCEKSGNSNNQEDSSRREERVVLRNVMRL
jgi:hypothetical protein